MNESEQLENEADEMLKAMYSPEPDVAGKQDSISAEQAADTENRSMVTEADQDTTNAQATSPDNDQEGLTIDNAKERIKNAQARMTRATQEAAQLRNELEPIMLENQSLRSEIDGLAQALTAQKESPPMRDTVHPDADLESLLDDYPDIIGPIIKKNQLMHEQLNAMQKTVGDVQETVIEQQKTAEHRQQEAVFAAHLATIRAAHQDVDNIANSDDFIGWVSRQSPLRKTAYHNGTAEEVIELIDLYKQAVGKNNKLEEAREVASPATPRARRQPSNARPRFTRDQIAAMSAAEFTKNEAAIDEAMSQGLVY